MSPIPIAPAWPSAIRAVETAKGWELSWRQCGREYAIQGRALNDVLLMFSQAVEMAKLGELV